MATLLVVTRGTRSVVLSGNLIRTVWLLNKVTFRGLDWVSAAWLAPVLRINIVVY